jgi:hypothetical protein
MTMPGLLHSEIFAQAEVAYRRERMLAGPDRMHRRVYPFHWRRHIRKPQPTPSEPGNATAPVRRPAPVIYPHSG